MIAGCSYDQDDVTRPVNTVGSRESNAVTAVNMTPVNHSTNIRVDHGAKSVIPLDQQRRSPLASGTDMFPTGSIKRKRSPEGKPDDKQREVEDMNGLEPDKCLSVKRHRADESMDTAAYTSSSSSISSYFCSLDYCSRTESHWDFLYDDQAMESYQDVTTAQIIGPQPELQMSLQDEHYNRVAALVGSASPTILLAEQAYRSDDIELALFRDMIAWLEP